MAVVFLMEDGAESATGGRAGARGPAVSLSRGNAGATCRLLTAVDWQALKLRLHGVYAKKRCASRKCYGIKYHINAPLCQNCRLYIVDRLLRASQR